MKKEDIIRKLTSRKFWAAVALFISGLYTAFGGKSETATTISGCIMQGAAVIGYLLAEGLTDAKTGTVIAIDSASLSEDEDDA